MKIRFNTFFVGFIGILLFLIVGLFLDSAFSAASDTFQANVTVGNVAPTVSNVFVNDTDPSTPNITLSAASENNIITCNATITDLNGYGDFSSGGGYVNATFFQTINSTLYGSDSNISKYSNTSCSFTGASGTTATAVCKLLLHHEALNGTWNCTVFAKDQGGLNASNSTTEPVEQLVALSVAEDSIHFGSMTVGTSSTVANTTNVTNEGNVKIDVQVSGNDNMSCSILGAIGLNNISYNTTGGAYSTMSANKLSQTLATLSAFNLTSQGVSPFAANQNATNLTYWTINIPNGVRGECNNTITISALLSPD